MVKKVKVVAEVNLAKDTKGNKTSFLRYISNRRLGKMWVHSGRILVTWLPGHGEG